MKPSSMLKKHLPKNRRITHYKVPCGILQGTFFVICLLILFWALKSQIATSKNTQAGFEVTNCDFKFRGK
jgi:hypothetical protein